MATNGTDSSYIPNTAPPKENIVVIIGIIKISLPLNTLTILTIPKSIAFVLDIILKAPPTINKNAIISAPSIIPCIGACKTLNKSCG